VARAPTPREEQADGGAGEQELRLDRHARAVPSAAAMKEVLATRSKPGHQVLEIRHGSRDAAHHGSVERPSPRGEHGQREKAASDLKALVGDVLMRHQVACDMKERAEEERE
jgi:hypothetical protein